MKAKKDVCHLFGALLRRQIGSVTPTVDYVARHPDIVFNTLAG